jgi:hypothetical protein
MWWLLAVFSVMVALVNMLGWTRLWDRFSYVRSWRSVTDCSIPHTYNTYIHTTYAGRHGGLKALDGGSWEPLHTRDTLIARDHYTSSTLIGGKARAGPNLLPTWYAWGTNGVWECKMDVKSTWIPTRHQMDHDSQSLGPFSKFTSWR